MTSELEWEKAIVSYLKEPKEPKEEIQRKIDEIAALHGLDNFMATVLFLAKDKE